MDGILRLGPNDEVGTDTAFPNLVRQFTWLRNCGWLGKDTQSPGCIRCHVTSPERTSPGALAYEDQLQHENTEKLCWNLMGINSRQAKARLKSFNNEQSMSSSALRHHAVQQYYFYPRSWAGGDQRYLGGNHPTANAVYPGYGCVFGCWVRLIWESSNNNLFPSLHSFPSSFSFTFFILYTPFNLNSPHLARELALICSKQLHKSSLTIPYDICNGLGRSSAGWTPVSPAGVVG